MRAELVDSSIVDALFCEMLLAYITRMFALVGAKGSRFTHPACSATDARRCVFVGEWGE